MGRKTNSNNERERVKGVNNCILGGIIQHWFPAKKDNAPDMIVIKVPYGDYGTNVACFLWHDNEELFKYINDNDIDEGNIVVCDCEVVCSKKYDYKPQFYIKTMELLENNKQSGRKGGE
jgi:hypothetical protein